MPLGYEHQAGPQCPFGTQSEEIGLWALEPTFPNPPDPKMAGFPPPKQP